MDLNTLDESEIDSLSYRNLQILCKANKIRANQKSAALKENLICLKRKLSSESTDSSQSLSKKNSQKSINQELNGKESNLKLNLNSSNIDDNEIQDIDLEKQTVIDNENKENINRNRNGETPVETRVETLVETPTDRRENVETDKLNKSETMEISQDGMKSNNNSAFNDERNIGNYDKKEKIEEIVLQSINVNSNESSNETTKIVAKEMKETVDTEIASLETLGNNNNMDSNSTKSNNNNNDNNNNNVKNNDDNENNIDINARASILAELDIRMKQSGYSGVSTDNTGKTEYVSLNGNSNSNHNSNGNTNLNSLKKRDRNNTKNKNNNNNNKSKGSKDWNSIHEKEWNKGPSLGEWFDAKQKRSQKLLQSGNRMSSLSSTARKRAIDKTKLARQEKQKQETQRKKDKESEKENEKTKRNTKMKRHSNLNKIKNKRVSNTTKISTKRKSEIQSKTVSKNKKRNSVINNGSTNGSNSMKISSSQKQDTKSKNQVKYKTKSRKLSGIQPTRTFASQQWDMHQATETKKIETTVTKMEIDTKNDGQNKKSRKSILIKQDSENIGININENSNDNRNKNRNITSNTNININTNTDINNINSKMNKMRKSILIGADDDNDENVENVANVDRNESKSSSVSTESIQDTRMEDRRMQDARVSKKKKRRATHHESLLSKRGRKCRSAQKINGQGWTRKKMSFHSSGIDKQRTKLNVKLDFDTKEENDNCNNNNSNDNNNNKKNGGISRLTRPTVASSVRARSKVKKRTFTAMMEKQNGSGSVSSMAGVGHGMSSSMGMGMGIGIGFGVSNRNSNHNNNNNNNNHGFNTARLPRKRLAYDPSKVKAKVNSYNHNHVSMMNRYKTQNMKKHSNIIVNDENNMGISNISNKQRLSLSKVKHNWNNVQSKVDTGISSLSAIKLRKQRKSLPGKRPIKYNEQSSDIGNNNNNSNNNDNTNSNDNSNNVSDEPPTKRRRISKC